LRTASGERDVIRTDDDGTTRAGRAEMKRLALPAIRSIRTPEHWRRVALIVAKRTGRKIGLESLARDEADDVATRLLETVPTAKIVALSSDNRRALCCTIRHQPLVLTDFSGQEIAAFISRAH